MENEQLVWQALSAKEIWMCSMVLLMGDLEEGRQQRSKAIAANGCGLDGLMCVCVCVCEVFHESVSGCVWQMPNVSDNRREE